MATIAVPVLTGALPPRAFDYAYDEVGDCYRIFPLTERNTVTLCLADTAEAAETVCEFMNRGAYALTISPVARVSAN